MELIGWLNNHGKVWKIFDNIQEQISQNHTGIVTILTYLVANLTHWTTLYITFEQLLHVKDAMQLGVMQCCGAIIAAQVGAAKYPEKDELTKSAELTAILSRITIFGQA